jgi:hypothetical protein
MNNIERKPWNVYKSAGIIDNFDKVDPLHTCL